MKVSVLGRNGFIGNALFNSFKDPYWYPRPDLDYLFWFASPSSQRLFDYAPDLQRNETIEGFVNIVKFCNDNHIKLIYPLTLSYGNIYARTKNSTEIGAIGNTLGVKIATGYGPGEDHKGDYASVVYQFCKAIKKGERPIIYGDGNQTRDFVFIYDIVDTIIENMDQTGIIEIGTGIKTSFNELVDIINEENKTDVKPLYVEKPEGYVEEIICKNPIQFNYSLREGVREILNSL